MVNVPDMSKLLNVLPIALEAGKGRTVNRTPDIVQAIMADKTRNRQIKSNENLSREEMVSRAQAQDKALALEGQRIQSQEQQSQLDRDAQLEGINRQLMGRLLDTVVEEYGVESLKGLRSIIPGFGAGQDENTKVGDIDINKAKEGLSSIGDFTPNPDSVPAKLKDISSRYNSGELDGVKALTDLASLPGKAAERLAEKINRIDRLKKSDPSIDMEKIDKLATAIKSGKPLRELMKDGASPDQLDLASNLVQDEVKNFGPDRSVVDKLRQGGDVDPVSAIKAYDRLKKNDKTYLTPEDDEMFETHRLAQSKQYANNAKSLAKTLSSGDLETNLQTTIPQLIDAKSITEYKSYAQNIYAPVRNAYEDKIRKDINGLDIDSQIKMLEDFNKFESSLGSKNIVSVPIVRPVARNTISRFKPTGNEKKGYTGIPITGQSKFIEVTGFRPGSPAEARRAINELKRLKDANN